MTWKEFVYRQVIDHCNNAGSRTFSLKHFLADKLDIFNSFRPNNQNVEAKIRQQLQFLHDEKLITFMDNSGHYTLRGVDVLAEEAKETKHIDLSNVKPERREYVVETFVRKVGWVKKAVGRFGDDCLYKKCKNSFLREDGTRYIEVHHIVPLCKGGEEGLWNLSVLCAHHHRMAHYGDVKTRVSLEKYLLREVKARL